MTHCTSILLVALSLAATCFAQRPRTNVTGDYLLKTAWGGSSPFNALAPHGSALGCHANALAQILYFHRLAPHGRVSYQSTGGVAISENFSQYKPQWERFALTTNSTDARAIQETSRFMYYVAAVVRKDFGTDQYVDYPNDAHKQAIESHFDCTLTSYENEVTSDIEGALRSGADMYALVKAEIEAGRPAGFYYTYGAAGGHAVVIDGYTVHGGKTCFHVNFGWFGSSDGWYALAEDLPQSTKSIVLVTIAPDAARKDGKAGNPKSEQVGRDEPPPRFSVPRWAAVREGSVRSIVPVGGGQGCVALAASLSTDGTSVGVRNRDGLQVFASSSPLRAAGQATRTIQRRQAA